MKTAEELWNKYEMLTPEDEIDEDGTVRRAGLTREQRRTDCMFYDDFFKAIAEHDSEIISKIDEMSDTSEIGVMAHTLYWQGYVKSLTELKQWMEK